MFLDTATALITKELHHAWWQAYGFDKEEKDFPNLKEKIKEFNSLLNNIEDDIFDFYNLSILEGEYVSDNETANKLSRIHELLVNGKKSVIEAPDEEVQQVFSYFILAINRLELATNFYIDFVSNINRKLEFSDKEYILSYNDDIFKAISNKQYSSINLRLLQINIRIADSDHFLSVDDEQLGSLIRLSKQLEYEVEFTKNYLSLIKIKCTYLINKLLLRIRLEYKNDDVLKSKPVYIIANGIEQLVSVSYFKDGIFNNWLDYLSSHYQLDDNWKDEISEDYSKYKNIPLNKCTIRQLHRMIKYHKDVNRVFPISIDLIHNIRCEINNRLDEAIEKNDIFEIYTLSVDLNYAINNEFSLICEEKNPYSNIEQVQNLYFEIKSIQRLTGIRNFFPQTKYLGYLLRILKQTYSDKQALGNVEECRRLINICQDVYSEYEQNIDWSTKNYTYVFQLPLTDCIIEVSKSQKIFVFSTFLLPLTKDNFINIFNENKREVAQLEASVKVFENISKEMKELELLKASVEGLNRSTRDREFRTIEMISIFTAIISFVAASLPTFKVIDTSLEAFFYMLALATSFSAFVLLLLIAFRGGEAVKSYKNYIVGFCLSAAIVWSITLTLPYFNSYFRIFIEEKSTEDESNSSNKISNSIIVSPVDVIEQIQSNGTNRLSNGRNTTKKNPCDTIKKDTIKR